MKNTYMSAWQWVHKPHLRLLLLLLLALPFMGQAQNLTVSPVTTAAAPDEYGSVAVGSVSNPAKQYSIVGTGLTGSITVNLATAPSFEASTDGTTYATNVTLPATGGTLYVRFRPTAIGTTAVDASNGRIIVTGSDADFNNYSRNIWVRGTGVAGTPNIDVTPDARIFSPTVVNTASTPQPVTVTASSLSAPITVTAPNGYEVSNANVNGGAFATSITLPQTNGSVNTTVNIRFVPTQAITYNNVSVSFASPGAQTKFVAVSGTGVLPKPTLLASPSTLPDFGSVAVGSSSVAVYSFNVNGQDLQGPVTITPPAGFRIRVGNTGFFSTSAITLTPTNGSLATPRLMCVSRLRRPSRTPATLPLLLQTPITNLCG